MKYIYKILLGTDFSENAMTAFKYALNLVHSRGASIEVLHVVSPTTVDEQNPLIQTPTEKAVIKMKAFVDEGLKNCKVDNKLLHDKIQTNIETGNTTNIISKTIESDNISLLMLGTTGKNDGLEKKIGHISHELLNSAKCDILIVPKKAVFQAINNLIYTSDFSMDDPFYIWKARNVFNKVDFKLEYLQIQPDSTSALLRKRMESLKYYFQDNIPSFNINFSTIRARNTAMSILEFAKKHDGDAIALKKKGDKLVYDFRSEQNTMNLIDLSDYPLLIIQIL